MGVVFLLIRFIVGGYFAWQGAQLLDAYGRQHLVAYARTKDLPMPSVAVPVERRKFVRNVALAFVALTLLFVPQPWPLTVGR